MDAIVICGGKGTRVRSITDDEYPKIMIEVNGYLFVNYLMSELYDMGVRNVTFSAGYLGAILRSYINKHYEDQHIVLIEDEPLDTGGAVVNALKLGNIHTDPFLVVNGDCIVKVDRRYDSYEHLYYASGHGKSCAMFTCFMDHDGRYGNLHMSAGGVIRGFRNGQPGESFINCGWYIMRKKMFWGQKVKRMSLEKDVFPNHIEMDGGISPLYVTREQFIEIGTPEAIERAEVLL